MDTNYMNKLVSNNFSCDSNVDVSQFLRMCGFGIYLKLISLLIKKILCIHIMMKSTQVREQLILKKCKRRLDCLKRCIYRATGKRKTRARLKLPNRSYKERTLPYDLTDKHEVYFVMHNALKVMDTCLWYLDSGCSRHMTGDHSLFKTFEPKRGGNVTFRDGSKSQIKGKWIISLPLLLDIANVLYVEGLRVNLLSISQICDQDFMVLFSKGKCLVLNELGEQLINGVHTLDNCYGLVPNVEIVCNSIWMPNEDLWYQRMGHASYKQLFVVSKKEAMLGIPKLVKVDNAVCGPC